MTDLIKALQIFAKYLDAKYPTACDHGVLYVIDIKHEEVTAADRAMLDTLGFDWSDAESCWLSFRYGSA